MADGRRFLILHGDAFDGIVRYARWLAFLGDRAYNTMITINHWYNQLRHLLGYDYWSLSAYLKHKVKNAVEYISNFEHAVAEEAKTPRRRRRRSAATSTRRRSATSTTSSTATTATGWRAAPRWSSIATAGWRSSTGRRCARSRYFHMTQRATAALMRILIVTDAWHAAGERRGAHPDPHARGTDAAWAMRCMSSRPTCSTTCPARPIRRSAWRCCRSAADRDDRGVAALRPSTSRPRGRWARRRGATA